MSATSSFGGAAGPRRLLLLPGLLPQPGQLTAPRYGARPATSQRQAPREPATEPTEPESRVGHSASWVAARLSLAPPRRPAALDRERTAQHRSSGARRRRAAATVHRDRDCSLSAPRPARAPAMAAPGRLLLRPRPGGLLLLLLPGLLLPLADAFNLDVESPAEYAGPEGSYFGFAVDFFVPSTSS